MTACPGIGTSSVSLLELQVAAGGMAVPFELPLRYAYVLRHWLFRLTHKHGSKAFLDLQRSRCDPQKRKDEHHAMPRLR